MADVVESQLAQKALHDLEWAALLERIARYCLSGLAVTTVSGFMPASSLDEARARMTLSAEALSLTEDGLALPVEAIADVSDVLERARRGAVATGPELADVGRMLRSTRALRLFASSQAERRPNLARALESAAALDVLADDIARAIEADGSISDQASPELRQARRRAADGRRELMQRVNELVARYAEVLRERYVVERDGRYTLPVRADAHLRVPGIVLGASASGGTLYVEPQETIGLGNRLRMALADVEREELRVLSELTNRVGESMADVERARDVCVTADVLAAITRWAVESRAYAILPGEAPAITLQAMRHPLLIGHGREVVPNDVAVAAGQALVVSGPNAGGKTVALKCLGLAACMVASGIPVPAQPDSEIGWFSSVLSDVGDEQSIARSLSTFSAHVDNIARIIAHAGPNVLVLLDELAGGTDPEEGAALAVAVLEALVERGAAVATTTHYERLKEVAADDARFQNASVGFDLASMAPTFRLTLGVPGPSSALAVARRFGIPDAVVDRARELVPQHSLDREELLRTLAAEREALRLARATAESEAEKQALIAQQLERERALVREKERARLTREAEHLMVAVREARARLRGVEQGLADPRLRAERLVALEREIDQAARPIAVGGELAAMLAPPAPASRAAEQTDLVPGARVFLTKLARPAEVLEPPARGQVRVLAGALKLLVPVDEVELATGPGPRKHGRRPEKKSAASELKVVSGFVPLRTKGNTLDLRGERVEEALSLVDAFLDRMLSEGEPAAFVLHGHGTGKLKSAVRQHVAASRYVARSGPAAPDDGGDAFTIVWFGA